LTPFCDLWVAQYGGTPQAGWLAKALKPLVDEHGPDETIRRWRYYLSQTPAEYASPTRFAATWGRWDPETEPPSQLGIAEGDWFHG
jgi:hypothetical protein